MNYLEIFGTFIGIIYLWLEYRASIYLWLAGIIMPAIYIFVYYDAGLYADFGINIYYLIAKPSTDGSSGCGDTGKRKVSPLYIPRGNAICHYSLCLSCLSSASPGYLSNTQTVTFRGWTVSQRR